MGGGAEMNTVENETEIAMWMQKLPGFIRGLDPMNLSLRHLEERVAFELDLWDEGEEGCDITVERQAVRARAFLKDIRETLAQL